MQEIETLPSAVDLVVFCLSVLDIWELYKPGLYRAGNLVLKCSGFLGFFNKPIKPKISQIFVFKKYFVL